MFSALLLSTASAVAQAAPEFVPGDVADLSCKVARLTSDRDTFVLEVDVRNRGRITAEPLVFEVTARPNGRRKDETALTIARARMPWAFRAGRPVPAGRTTRYHLYGSIWELPKRLEVSVTRASFFTGSLTPEPDDDQPPVQVGGITQDTLAGAAGTVPVSRIALHNTLPRPVDVLLRARFSRPRDAVGLITASLGAGEERTVPVESFVGSIEWMKWGQASGAKVEEVELVDWCQQFPQDEAKARQALLDAYVNWVRWEAPTAVRGAFAIRATRDGVRRQGKGMFTLSKSGKVEIDWDGPQPEGVAIGSTLRDAFRNLQRPSVAELTAQNRFARMADDLVAVAGPGWRQLSTDAQKRIQGDAERGILVDLGDDGGMQMFRITDGRLCASGWSLSGNFEEWTLEDHPRGYLVTSHRPNDGAQVFSWTYDDVDGVPVTSGYREVWKDATGAVIHEIELELPKLELDSADPSAGEPAPPRGPGLAALRAVWDATWAYPAEPVTLKARFDIETPATDGVWVGQKHVTGSVTIGGFRGYRVRGERWATVDIEIDDELPATSHGSLRDAVRDRLGLWAGRDVAGRGDFDDAFAGATIGAERRGAFPIDGGPYRAVEVKKGLIAGFDLGGGTERSFHYDLVGGHPVPTRIVTGDEELLATWRVVDGYLVPVEFEFRRVFGRDWGPEVIELSDVRIER